MMNTNIRVELLKHCTQKKCYVEVLNPIASVHGGPYRRSTSPMMQLPEVMNEEAVTKTVTEILNFLLSEGVNIYGSGIGVFNAFNRQVEGQDIENIATFVRNFIVDRPSYETSWSGCSIEVPNRLTSGPDFEERFEYSNCDEFIFGIDTVDKLFVLNIPKKESNVIPRREELYEKEYYILSDDIIANLALINVRLFAHGIPVSAYTCGKIEQMLADHLLTNE